MTNVIDIPEQATFWTMNLLKKSIKHMKAKNTEGQYDIAILKEENILRSYFDQLAA
jgi:hypothetical protein